MSPVWELAEVSFLIMCLEWINHIVTELLYPWSDRISLKNQLRANAICTVEPNHSIESCDELDDLEDVKTLAGLDTTR
jgi:hypothetical protein